MKRIKFRNWMVLIPPLAVFLRRGLGINFILSIILTILGYVLGLAHAIWVCDGMKFEGGDDDFTPFGF